MPRRPHLSSPQGPERGWRIPPIPGHGAHAFAGAAVLEELDGPVAFALWQSLRDVHLWASTPPAERARLFGPGAARARSAAPEALAGRGAELRVPLRVLSGIVEDAAAARPDEVSAACAAVARWAEAEGAMASALAFAEAAAGAVPLDAALACVAGRLARRCGQYARAETWFLRTAGLGRWRGDWNSYARAWIGLGKLQIAKGSLSRARRSLLRALRAARRHRLRHVEGLALHNLCIVDMESGDLAAAETWARAAHQVYGAGSNELPRVAHDLALVWMLQGSAGRARAVFRALLPHFTRPADRLFVLANMVRAAGEAGEAEAFGEAWDAAWELARSDDASEGLGRAGVDLARGALALGEPALAERAALRAAEVAAGRDEAKARLEAEALLASLRHGGSTVPRKPEPEPGGAGADELAAEIIAELNAGAGR